MVNQIVLNYANKVLLSIGEVFLIESEYTNLPADLTDLSLLYNVLFSVMQARSSTQDSFDRLNAKAYLDHVTLPSDTTQKTYSSNILLGFGVIE